MEPEINTETDDNDAEFERFMEKVREAGGVV